MSIHSWAPGSVGLGISARGKRILLVTIIFVFGLRFLPFVLHPPHLPHTQRDEAQTAIEHDVAKDRGLDDKFLVLKDICAKVVFREGLFLRCQMENGFANLRNELQSCVMYALDAGAHILLPKAPGRRSDSELFSGSYPLAAWFDMTRFKRLMTLHCGNLTIAEDEDLANITTIVFPTPRNHLFRWTSLRGELDGFQQLQEANYSIHQPLALQVDTLFRWEFTTHPVEQLRVMFDITQPNQFLTQLASNVGASLLQVRPGRYLGIHLRIESDAVGWHGGDWRALAKNFFERALAVSAETGITTWYVSCGDKQRLREFQADGSARNISVLSKWELMNAEEAAIVEGLLFDQVAVIDGLILTKAALFLGMGRSSFSRMIARDREFTNAGGSETIQAWDHYNVCCW